MTQRPPKRKKSGLSSSSRQTDEDVCGIGHDEGVFILRPFAAESYGNRDGVKRGKPLSDGHKPHLGQNRTQILTSEYQSEYRRYSRILLTPRATLKERLTRRAAARRTQL